MQDNRFHISEEFIDQSWDKMKHSLDRELPVRRVVPFWFYILGLIFSLSIAYFAWDQFSSTKTFEDYAQEHINESPINNFSESTINSISIEKSTTERNEQNATFNSDDNIIDEKVQVEQTDINTFSKQTEQSNMKAAPIIVEASLENSLSGKLAKQSDQLPIVDSSIGMEKEDLQIENTAIAFTKTLAGNDNVHGRQAESYLNMLTLPSLQLSSFIFSYPRSVNISFINQSQYIEPLQRDKKITVQPGVYASLLRGANSKGFDAGIFTGFNLSSKWKLNTSIGAHQLSYDISEDELLESAADLGAALDTSFSASPLSVLDQELANNLISTTTYLDGQLTLGYQPIPNLWINSGAELSYLLQASNKEISVLRSNIGQEVVELDANYLKENELLKKIDFAIVAGLEYRLHHRFSIIGQYRYGLNELLNSGNQTLAMQQISTKNKAQRFFRLGMKFFL